MNFVTCHDGFTLNDLVSYNVKHNEANGDQNRDGSDYNLSWNCGVEGPSEDPAIEQLRTRQVKNFLALTLLSVGTPMLLAGDEVRSSQRGNNNAYCRSDELFSFDWALIEKYAEVYRFTKHLIKFRLNRNLPAERFDMTLRKLLLGQLIQWHGVKLNSPDWSENSHTIAATWALLKDQFLLHLMINAYWESLELPDTVHRSARATNRGGDVLTRILRRLRTFAHSKTARSCHLWPTGFSLARL